MRILILEDETISAKRLKKLLEKLDPSNEIVEIIKSVKDAVDWFGKNQEPDLMFVDIELTDGVSLEIFDNIEIKTPIIFTTAYDEYAIQAFKVNSIDYLLKPVSAKDLEKSLDKFYRLKDTFSSKDDIESLLNQLNTKELKYKTRFLIQAGQSLKSIPVEDIAYFYIKNQMIFLTTHENKRLLVDNTLDEISAMIDPSNFYRINRQMIVSINSIKSIHFYSNSRLNLELTPSFGDDVIVSREKVKQFKEWLDR